MTDLFTEMANYVIEKLTVTFNCATLKI